MADYSKEILMLLGKIFTPYKKGTQVCRYAGINLLSRSPWHVPTFIAEVRYQHDMTAVISDSTVCFSALFKMKFGNLQ